MVPHTDTRVVLRKYCDELTGSGLKGVYNFPLASPIAEISRELNAVELKSIAQKLRGLLNGGKFCANEIAFTEFPEGGSLFGHRLDLEIPAKVFSGVENTIKTYFSPLIIGEFLLRRLSSDTENNKNHFDHFMEEFLKKIPAPQITFRAAAAANMRWKPFRANPAANGEISFKWEIGKLSWLPR